jgi:deoxyribonuclease-4
MTPLGSNRDRHAVIGEGELGEKGCAAFVSEPRFKGLPCVIETGRDGGRVTAADIELARKLHKRGAAARARTKKGRT